MFFFFGQPVPIDTHTNCLVGSQASILLTVKVPRVRGICFLLSTDAENDTNMMCMKSPSTPSLRAVLTTIDKPSLANTGIWSPGLTP